MGGARAVLLAGLILRVSPVSAQEQSPAMFEGSGLYQMCTGTNPVARHYCGGFIAGIMGSLMEPLLVGELKACIPEAITVGQGIDVVVNYMLTNAEYRTLPSAFVATLAFVEAYPCRLLSPEPGSPATPPALNRSARRR